MLELNSTPVTRLTSFVGPVFPMTEGLLLKVNSPRPIIPLMEEIYLNKLKSFFEKDTCQKGASPLKEGVEIEIFVNKEGPVTLKKEKDKTSILNSAPKNPDITCHIPEKGLELLLENAPEDLAEVGVHITKLLIHSDPDTRIKLKVHIGLFTFIKNGYFGILPLGGPSFMKFLATKGLSSIGRIKEIISNLRDHSK